MENRISDVNLILTNLVGCVKSLFFTEALKNVMKGTF